MAIDLEDLGFRVVVGSRSADTFTSTITDTAFFGGPGDDRLIASAVLPADEGAHFLLGGSGADEYVVETETFAVIGDGGSGDVVRAPELSFAGSTIFEVDRQHLGVVDPETGAGLLVLDWVGAGRIETFEFADGTQRFGLDLNPVELRLSPAVITDLDFGELARAGVLPSGLVIDDEVVEALIARSDEVEESAGDGFTIVGGNEPDVLTGTEAADVIDGAGGNDRITGGGGNDRLTGGDGDDVIIAGSGSDRVDGGRDDDRLSGDGGRDVLRGAAGNDDLDGGGGNDKLRGGADQDTLDGGNGKDKLAGGAGDDDLDGGGGNDELRGGAGQDTLDGGRGKDRLAGGAGDDDLDGQQGNDTVRGGAGDDDLAGGDGDDRMFGGGGRDVLDGGAGRNVFTGGGGRDRFEVTDLDRESDRITDYRAGEVVDLSALVDGKPVDSLEGFVRVRTLLGREQTRLDVDPDGGGDDFVQAVRLDGVLIEDFSAADLGFDASLGGPPPPPNRDPVAVDDSAETTEDQAVAIDVLSNDSDPNDNPFSVVAVDASTTDAAVEIRPSGRIRFDPRGAFDQLDEGDVVTETFTYTIEDSRGGRATAEVEVEVAGRNDAPEVGADLAPLDAETSQAFTFDVPDDAFVDPDADDSLSLAASGPDGGDLPDWLSFDGDAGRFSGTPGVGDVGLVEIELRATDQAGLEAETTFSFEVVAGGVVLRGNDEANLLVGGDGQDLILGEGGADDLRGGAGNDRIEGGLGGDLITGGPGDDVLRGDPEGGPTSSDLFVYEATGDGLDRILDFESGVGGDVLVLDDIVAGDASRIELNDQGAQTVVRVDDVDLLVLSGVSDVSLDSLIADGNLTVGAAA